jgi:hypothetical protein
LFSCRKAVSPPGFILNSLAALEVSIMNSIVIHLIIFVSIFGAVLFGMFLRGILPEQHLSADSKDTIRLGIAVIATMSALVLGLLVSSAKNFSDAQSSEITQMSANVILLDAVLAQYGPETKEVRDLLRDAVARTVDFMWHQDHQQNSKTQPMLAGSAIIHAKIRALSPKNDIQHAIQAQASSLAIDLGKLRWLMFEQERNSISVPLLVTMILWLGIVFTSFGLFAPRNATVIVTLFLCALSVSGAIFLILEMYRPLEGLMQVSSAPLRNALAQLGH